MYGCPRFWHNNQYFPGLLKFLVIISSLLSFTTALANISILFALPQVTSVHPPSKPLPRSLTMTDFGFSLIAQPLAITMILSSLKGTGISVMLISLYCIYNFLRCIFVAIDHHQFGQTPGSFVGDKVQTCGNFQASSCGRLFSSWLKASFVGFLYVLNPRVYFIVRGVVGTLNLIV